jgi:hypothetical protein
VIPAPIIGAAAAKPLDAKSAPSIYWLPPVMLYNILTPVSLTQAIISKSRIIHRR